jgi:hypothetical protein
MSSSPVRQTNSGSLATAATSSISPLLIIDRTTWRAAAAGSFGGGTCRSSRVTACISMARPVADSLSVLSVMMVLRIAAPDHRAAATGQSPVGRSPSGARGA